MAFPASVHDFVVVGGGSAGCVLAARLSEDENVRVLLLEAGAGQPLEASAVPPAWPTLLGSSMDWCTSTVELAATGSPMPWPRGRGLGGCSALNGMVFARGHSSSYDAWTEAGAKGWGFADLLPYFRRTENVEGRDPALRGVGGPLTVRPAEPNPAVRALLDAAAEAGHPVATDISGGREEGFGLPDLNIVDGARQSAADAYLRPALRRPNLDVVTDAPVHRVLVEGGRCTGVEYRVGTEVVTAACTREVVLTAGVVGSAQLLLLSGIGPRAHLREVGVDLTLDLPGVGANMHDHPMTTVVYTSRQPMAASANNHGEAIGLVRSGPGTDGPDLQILFVAMPYYDVMTLPGPQEGYTIAVSLMNPRSRGTVRLATADPAAAPLLDPAYLTDERDLQVMALGLRMAREIGDAPALDPWRDTEALPGLDVFGADRIQDYLRRSLLPYFHGVGTCRIGSDDAAVVDSDLRVHGIDGLRVADASVMPSIVSANTHATVYAIAERAAVLLTG
ncbi:GMC family oxidoreductase [Pseudonocardia xinjiangensis]|uniref:GMC family oxidoreductase n=1 Tax=Pseudonocardia xinjiangensis TaxID=75289 RepID=UPI003D92B761